MDFDAIRKETVEWIAQLALKPGWIDYAREMVMRYDKDPTGVFKGISKEVSQRVKELKNEKGQN